MLPARLLIHTCIYSVPAGRDRDGNALYSDTALTGVRIAPVTLATAQNAQGETKNDRLTLYYDPVASTPQGLELAEQAKITWNGKVYFIRAVTPCYTKDAGAVHHYEAALI